MQRSLSAQNSYRALLKRLATLSPPLFVMGGFAEDALLFHRITGHHADLDVLVVRRQLEHYWRQLAAPGLAGPAIPPVEAREQPLRPTTGTATPQVEIWVCSPEPDGSYSFEVEGQSPASRYRIFLPEDTFEYQATTIEGIPIQTVSPLALYHLRAISAMTRHVGEKQAQDLAMKEQLRQAFLADQDESKLTPKVKTRRWTLSSLGRYSRSRV